MSKFMHEDQIKANMTYPQLFQRLWPYGKKSRGFLFATLVSVLCLTVSSRILPSVIGYAIDEGILKSNPSTLIQAAFVFLFFEVLKSVSQWGYLFFFQRFGNRVLYFVREDLIRHTQSLPMDYFHRTPTGRTVTRVTNDTSNLGDLFTDGVITVFTEAISLIAILVAMALISWQLALGTMFLAPAFIWLAFKISNNVRRVLRESKKILSVVNSFVAENLNGIKIIQLYNRVPRNRKKFDTLSESYRDITIESIRAYSYLQPVTNLFNAVTISIALLGGSYFVLNGHLAVGAMVAFLMHVQDFIPPLREILEKYQQFQNSLTSAERVFQMLEEPSEIESVDKSTDPLAGSIELRDLNFRYQAELPLVLKDVNLKINAGESIALMGRTGSGKSTLITLLQRFYEAPPKSVFIDGIAIEDISQVRLRSQVGVVLQENFIFRGTIRENIHLHDPRIGPEQVQKSCERIGYLELLKRSGRDLDSQVDERGANLSVGERQLLAFARILAFEPKILILDEATANIDSQTEEIIHRATTEMIKGRTSLIIAHRLSTLRECNRVIEMSHGELKEVDRSTLLKQDPSALLASHLV